MKKTIGLTAVILLLVAACTWIAKKETPKTEQLSLTEEKELPKHRRVAERGAMELAITQDPALGYIPNERIIEAKAYADQLRNETVSLRDAIDNVTWTNRGPKKVGGRTRAIVFDPADATHKAVIAGGVTGGFWKNPDITDPASTWTKVSDSYDNIAITVIAVDPNNSMIMYAGTGEAYSSSTQGLGVFKSTDGGNSWTLLSNTSSYKYISDVVVRNEGGTSVVYVGSNEDFVGPLANPSNNYSGKDGLFRSTNGGDTWSSASVLPLNSQAQPQDYQVDDIDMDANGNLWVATGKNAYGHPGGAIFRCSTGCGTSTNWTKVHSEDGSVRVVLAPAPSDATVMYAVSAIDAPAAPNANNDCKWIKRTSNATSATPTWVEKTIPPSINDNCDPDEHFTGSQGTYGLEIAVHPTDPNVVIAGGISLIRTTDGGDNWQPISYWHADCPPYPAVHADQHIILYRPGSPNEIIVGNDGGIAYSPNAGNSAVVAPTYPSWAHHNIDYNITQFYSADIYPTAGTTQYIAGAQDNGTPFWNNAASIETIDVIGGDGSFSHIDQDNPMIQVGAYIYGDISVTGNAWSTKENFTIGSSLGRFINPSDYDDTNNILYAASAADQYIRVKNIGTGNTPNMPRGTVNVNLGGKIATTVKVDPNSPKTVYFGTDGGQIFKVTSADATPSVTDVTSNIFSDDGWYVTSVDVQVGNSMHLLATFGNYGVESVWESTDGGQNWTNVEGNLPDMPIRWGIFSPENPAHALLATELGVWSTKNLGASSDWDPTNGGLANVRVDMIKWRTSDNTMIAATFGRGIYTAKIGEGGLATDLVQFEATGQEHTIQLDWATASEKDHASFELTRSESLTQNFKKIAQIEAKGNTNNATKYQYVDTDVKSDQIYYYRLRMRDTNGKEELSNIVTASIEGNIFEDLLVYPNPTINELNIKLPILSGDTEVRLFNVSGQLLRTQTVDDTTQASKMTINVADLAEGTYFVQIRNEQKFTTKQFIIAR